MNETKFAANLKTGQIEISGSESFVSNIIKDIDILIKKLSIAEGVGYNKDIQPQLLESNDNLQKYINEEYENMGEMYQCTDDNDSLSSKFAEYLGIDEKSNGCIVN